MEHHDKEQRQILQDVPDDRGILAGSSIDFEYRHQKPRPMQKYVDAGKAEQME
jgi:hypothetical protein